MFLVPGIRAVVIAMGIFVPRGGGFHADTVNWLTRVNGNGGIVSAVVSAAVNQAVIDINGRGLKTNDLRYNPQGGDALAMVVPVYVGDNLPALDVLHGSPTIDADGFDAGNVATKYSDTGINPATLAALGTPGWDTQNASMGLWMSDGNDFSTLVANKAMAGAYFSSGSQRWAMYWKSAGEVWCEFGDSAHNIHRNSRTAGIGSGHRLMFANGGVTDYWEDGVSAGGVNGGSVATAPAANILIGVVNNGGINGSGKFGGYHIGCKTPLTTQNAIDWADIMSKAAQAVGRMHNVLWNGDSLFASTTCANLYQSVYHPRTSIAFNAVGGTNSAQCLARMVTLFTVIATPTTTAGRPCMRWWNQGFLDGQNDSTTGGWDGSNTIANMTSMVALIPHNGIRVCNMILGTRLDEYTGQTKAVTKAMVSAAWLATYGIKCLNIRDLLLTNGTGTGQDAIDVANGVTPSSLHKRLGAYNISAVTKAANAAVTLSTSLAGAAQVGDIFDFASVAGMTQLNGNTYQSVTMPDNTHFTLNVDSTGFGTYTSGGTATLVDFIHFNTTADALIAGLFNDSTINGWNTAVNENPLITSVTPAIGTTAGGTAVTILGSGFTAVTSVKFDGIAATSVVVVDDNHITCVTPADSAGAVNCKVSTPYISNMKANAFTYQAPATISSLSPNEGTVAGGTPVTITGTNFVNVLAVTFDGIQATSVVVVGPTSITCVSPADSSGVVNVAVTTAANTVTKPFTYWGAPTFSSVSPNSGLPAGGTSITITGGQYTGSPTVTIGGVTCTSIVVVDVNHITAVTSAGTLGAKDIVIGTAFGSVTAPGAFTYSNSAYSPSMDFSDSRNSMYAGAIL